MRLVEGFCIREILDETVAIPTQNAAHYLSGLVAMNETGKFLFEMLQKPQTRESLISALLEEYEVDKETAQTDVDSFLKILVDNNLLEDFN